MPSFSHQDDLSWMVEHRPLYFPDKEGNLVRFENRVAVVRADNEFPLGTVSEDYETVQNEALKSLIQPLVEEEVLVVENMGYLNNGSKVFIQGKVNKVFQVNGFNYNSYITLLNGHTGNTSVAIGPSVIRVCCGNTFSMAYSRMAERFRHSQGVNDRILETKAVIEYVESNMSRYREKAEKLDRESCSMAKFQEFVSTVYNKRYEQIRFANKLEELFRNGEGNQGSTMYDAFNAITDYSSNFSRKTVSGRFNYANFGQGKAVNDRAMKVALELASAG